MLCSQLTEIEDLVLGTISPRRAQTLLAHVATCSSCAAERALVEEERALFTYRAEASAQPPAHVERRLHQQLDTESRAGALAAHGRRAAPALRRVLVAVSPGRFSGACAALLFAIGLLSRRGVTAPPPRASLDGVSHETNRSFVEGPAEPLACSIGATSPAKHP